MRHGSPARGAARFLWNSRLWWTCCARAPPRCRRYPRCRASGARDGARGRARRRSVQHAWRRRSAHCVVNETLAFTRAAALGRSSFMAIPSPIFQAGPVRTTVRCFFVCSNILYCPRLHGLHCRHTGGAPSGGPGVRADSLLRAPSRCGCPERSRALPHHARQVAPARFWRRGAALGAPARGAANVRTPAPPFLLRSRRMGSQRRAAAHAHADRAAPRRDARASCAVGRGTRRACSAH